MVRTLHWLVVATGATLTAIPAGVLPVCRYAGSPDVDPARAAQMPCFHGGLLVALVGALTVVALVLPRLLRKPHWRRGAFVAAAVLAVAALVFVSAWPGVCRMATMPCVIGTRPGVWLVAGLQLAVALGGVAALRGGRR